MSDCTRCLVQDALYCCHARLLAESLLVLPTGGAGETAWNPWTTAHATDALLLAVWFMLREMEWAAVRTQDLEAVGGTVSLRPPAAKLR